MSYLGDSNFTCSNFNFSFQHDARLRSENKTTTVISIFDNASDGGATMTTSQSSGKFIAINHDSGNAILLSETTFPSDGGLSSISQGNTQLLDNGGTFHGWGSNAYFSEHAPNGSTALLTQFADGTASNYRAFSHAWTSTPATTIPSVYAYAKNGTEGTRIYVSWNGATTVSSWRFYGAQEVGQNLTVLGETARRGFETV